MAQQGLLDPTKYLSQVCHLRTLALQCPQGIYKINMVLKLNIIFKCTSLQCLIILKLTRFGIRPSLKNCLFAIAYSGESYFKLRIMWGVFLLIYKVQMLIITHGANGANSFLLYALQQHMCGFPLE